MAQRSARARVKLDKISSSSGPPSPSHTRQKPSQGGGVARLGSGGLLTPSASSVSGSSRNSLQLQVPPRVAKGALRSFLDAQSEKLRGRLAHSSNNHRREGSIDGSTFYGGLGGGMGVGPLPGLGGLTSIGEEKIVVKRWEGNGSKGEIWDGGGKGKRDIELWFPDGDTLVYLTERPTPSRNPQGLYKPPVPTPSFRLRSSVLRDIECPFLISQLEESFRERPLTPAVDSHTPMDDGDSVMDYEYQLQRSRTMGSGHTGDESIEAGIQYRLYFPAPTRADKVSRHRHHLTTRNFFAVLFNKPLVGITLGQTLLDLIERTDLYLSTPSPSSYDLSQRGISDLDYPYGSSVNSIAPRGPGCTQAHRLILNYLQNREFDDVRNWPDGAAGLLVYAERVAPHNFSGLDAGEVQKVEAMWREGFVHCIGQLSRLEGTSEWREISPITKALIDRASLEIQVRVSNADARLSGFNFSDIWPSPTAVPHPARNAFDKFQKFLVKHYHSRFGSWPPQDGHLTRIFYVHLQRDFAALYDYLVDRDAVWDPPHNAQTTSSIQPRRIVKPNRSAWRLADDEELPMSDMLATFDQQNNHPPIPHPFCLVPPRTLAPTRLGNTSTIVAGSPPASNKRQQRFFPSPSTSSLRNRAASNPAAALALSESTNIEALYESRTINPLVEAFTAHEKSVSPSECPPHDARKGRWILIYCTLQTLASVAIDSPGIKWGDGVEYFLNPKLRGTPPWRTPSPSEPLEADERSHFRSHCWHAGKSRPVSPPITMIQPSRSMPIVTHATSISSLTTPPSSSGYSERRVKMDARSRSRSRTRMKRLQAMLEAEVQMADLDDGRKSPNSGDEGDDEMDGESPGGYDGLSPPPPVPPKWNGTMVEDKMRWNDAWGTVSAPSEQSPQIKHEPLSKPVPLSPFMPTPPVKEEKGKEKEPVIKEEKVLKDTAPTLGPRDVKQEQMDSPIKESQMGYFVM